MLDTYLIEFYFHSSSDSLDFFQHESGKVTDIVSTINTKLHSPGKDRVKTLLLLEKLLPQCSNETFADYSVGWMQHCCKWNQNSVNHELRILRQYLI